LDFLARIFSLNKVKAGQKKWKKEENFEKKRLGKKRNYVSLFKSLLFKVLFCLNLS